MMKDLRDNWEREFDLLAKLLADADENKLWEVGGTVNNSSGHLVKHLIGNLNHFIGAKLLDTGYVRQRDLEFGGDPEAVEDLLKQLEETKKLVLNLLDNVSTSDLEQLFPDEVFGHPMTTHYMLIRLYGHFTYHTGQISYLNRLM